MRAGTVFHLGIKELRGLMRDPALIAFIIYAFTLAVYTQSKAVPETLRNAPVAVVDEDDSALSRRITDAFIEPYFKPPALITGDEMDRRMDNGTDTFALDIPPNFQSDLIAGKSPTIQLNVDATRMTQAFSGSGYVQSIISAEISGFSASAGTSALPAVDLALRARFNPELNQGWFSAVMHVIDSVTMLSIILSGTALIRERERGTLEHLLVMPVTPSEIMASKVIAMGLVVLTATWLSLLFVVEGLLKVPIVGSVPLFMSGAVLHLAAMTALGIALATIAGSMPQFGLLLMLVLMPLEILSGATTPQENMPVAIQTIMLAAPNTHFIKLAQGVLFRGAGFSDVWPQFLWLAAISTILFGFSLRRFRKSLA